MAGLSIGSLPSVSPYRDIHPGYLIIEVADLYEIKQLQLIGQSDEKNKKTIADLNTLNDALNQILTCRDGNPDEHRLHDALAKLNHDFPELEFHDFIENYSEYNDAQWTACQEKITNKQKILMSVFNPDLMHIEELLGDKKRVQEIVADIIRQLNEFGHYLTSHQVARG